MRWGVQVAVTFRKAGSRQGQRMPSQQLEGSGRKTVMVALGSLPCPVRRLPGVLLPSTMRPDDARKLEKVAAL